ncbi:MAG TPA: ATP-binding protein, partial [bacterium]|nr:ATP-binding protein [bacterium]
MRDMCVFARHNVLTDPPFSRIDLVSCRNFLIYLESDLQHRVVPFLHYALRDHGYLMLGGSETIGSFRDLFEVQDAKNKIYSKIATPEKLVGAATMKPRGEFRAATTHEGRAAEHTATAPDPAREADRILLQRYSPPGVIVSGEFEILQFRGDTGKYLSPAPGKASLNLLKMLREGLLVSVRAALHKAKRDGDPVREEGLRVKTNGGHSDVNVEVFPIRANERAESFLILFDDPHRSTAAEAPPSPAEVMPQSEKESERELGRMRQELAATREYLQSVVEQQDAANEELQSANEEIQSSNEELQSINEELETSKEEIQSSNEELATLNEELQHRNAELSQSNNDLINLISSVHMPMVMIGNDFRIRKFSPAAEKLLNLIPTDIGRPFTDIKLNLSITDMEQKIDDVIASVRGMEEEVRDRNGRRYLLRIRPYKTLENRIEGAVIILIDVDEPLARETQILYRTYEPIFMWSVDKGISYWNRAAEEMYGYTKQQAIGKMPEDLLEASPAVFMDDLRRNGRWIGEVVHRTRSGTKIVMESRIAYFQELGGPAVIIEANRPIEGRENPGHDSAVKSSFQGGLQKSQFLAMLAHELRNPLAPLRNAVQVLHHPGADEEMRGRALRMMDRQVRSMTRLVDDLLDISRLAQGKIALQKEKVDVVSALKRSLEQTEHHFSAREQEVKTELPEKPVMIDADPARLEQIFANLLSNASKFTADRGHIGVHLENSKGKGSQVVVRIRDDGFGIAPEDLPGIFELFGREDLAHAKNLHGGLGIGLSLVRDLVIQHGGTIDAFSEGQGRGSEFVVRLPRDGKAPLQQAPRAVVANPPG